ncbi:D-serine/D-alanine/glycine transporter [Sanguibacter inulinus]|uniref:D-serine/D-alanine/glycine transporter n=1 Tax=Sanguibacter inulinus TaxID=60922 RepID=A0A853ES54_9MICO|nr:D-serine/D-alanine/glycine transporter [Sanguibacter inulinus]MBF0721088.1 D-serine/D-alanine/glycine transporter [Sanguibacter inulinus]NYS92233.1 D-serine/D-alanine/glycine transporter [Sanguibacter inulinus]
MTREADPTSRQHSTPTSPATGEPQLERALSNRHLQLIAIGGAIGTGLFMGSGKTISLAGPSVLLVYAVIGFMLFFVMRALGELLLSNLGYKSFRDITSDILGPWAGFFTGWTYWFCWIVTGIADIVAISGYMAFWAPDLARWIPALATILLLLGLNLVAVRLFGELEFWFAIIKIVAIVALVATGIVLVAIAFQSPDGSEATLTNLYSDGGFFPHGVSGFLAGFQIALFAFVGIELVGTAAAETKDPEKNLPRAINSIPIRIVLFYLGALFVIMAVTPWRSISPDESPFVAMFALAGLPAAAAVVNFVVLTSAASSANSGIFSTSRMMYGLAQEDEAPRSFGRLSKNHVPSRGLIFSCACLVPGVALLYTGKSVVDAFTLVTTVSSVLFMFVWTMIIVSYLRYRRDRPELHESSAFRMPGGVVMCWVVLAFFAAMIVVLLLEKDTRDALLVTPAWFVVLGVAWAVMRRRGRGGRASVAAPDGTTAV